MKKRYWFGGLRSLTFLPTTKVGVQLKLNFFPSDREGHIGPKSIGLRLMHLVICTERKDRHITDSCKGHLTQVCISHLKQIQHFFPDSISRNRDAAPFLSPNYTRGLCSRMFWTDWYTLKKDGTKWKGIDSKQLRYGTLLVFLTHSKVFV